MTGADRGAAPPLRRRFPCELTRAGRRRSAGDSPRLPRKCCVPRGGARRHPTTWRPRSSIRRTRLVRGPAARRSNLLHALTGKEGDADVVQAPPGGRNESRGRRLRGHSHAVRAWTAWRRFAECGAIDAADLELVIITAYADTPLLGDRRRHGPAGQAAVYPQAVCARGDPADDAGRSSKKWNVEREALAEKHRQLTGQSHRRLEAVLDATGDAIAMYDGTERLVFANRWYEALFDLPAEELRELSLSAAAGRFQECSPEFRVPNRIAEVGSDRALSRGRAASAPAPGRRGTSLFYQFTQPVSDSGGERMGDSARLPGRVARARDRADEGRGPPPAVRAGDHLRLQRDHRVESGDPQGGRAAAARGRQRRQRAGDGRERHRQGSRRQGPCTSTGRAARARSSRSTAPRCPRR